MEIAKNKTWVRSDANSGRQFVVSTKTQQLDLSFIQSAFESEHMGWAKRLSDDALDTMLDNSLSYGLYEFVAADANQFDLTSERASSLERGSLRQIGLARLITDCVTFAWVTDVIVVPEFQGLGLGTFLVQCVGEYLDDMKKSGAMRRAMLMIKNPKAVGFYNKHLGLTEMEQGKNNLVIMVSSTKLKQDD